MRELSAALTLIVLLVSGIAVAASEPQVYRYFEGLKSLQADFVQTIYDQKNRPLETSRGRMFMQRPGQFRWDYDQPVKQLIVADGQRLWLYDTELAQVTVRFMDQALSATPLALLSGAAPIEEEFTVSRSQSADGLVWYELVPKQEQPEFQILRVGFAGDDLKGIELEDTFNQRTRLEFTNLQRNVSIDPALMRFTPPKGVDVVGDVPQSR